MYRSLWSRSNGSQPGPDGAWGCNGHQCWLPRSHTRVTLVSEGPDFSWWGSDKRGRNWVLKALWFQSPDVQLLCGPVIQLRVKVPGILTTWLNQDRVARGTRPGRSSSCLLRISDGIFYGNIACLWLNKAKWPAFLFPRFPISKPAKRSKFTQLFWVTPWMAIAITSPCFTGFLFSTGESEVVTREYNP